MASNTVAPTRTAAPTADRSPIRSTVAFFALTLAASWLAWVPFVATELTALSIPDALTLPAIVVGGFGPAIAAVVLTWRGEERVRDLLSGLFDWRQRPRWYLFAFGVPVALVAVATGLYAALGNPTDPSVLPRRLAALPVQFAFVFLLGGGQEEIGWRGYALPRLQTRYSGTTASLVVGGAWALWHLPLFLVPASSQYGQAFLPYALAVLGFSLLLTWLYNATGGSVLLAMCLHAAINASSSLYPIPAAALADGFSDLLMIGVALAAWALAVALRLRDGPLLDPRSN
jgi:membrane protease YdiL (CAAX protease family)